MGKNDAAWEKAFEDLNILDEIEKMVFLKLMQNN